MKEKQKGPLRGFLLLLLFIDCVFFGDWVELFGFVLLTWVFLYLIVKTSVVNVAFTNAFSVSG